ncbi:hypothetical protein SAMD00019534_049160, partial [Acytostelium subglobosum LB1]|uniref:hypothetical protein n=1 Tax=Acytostelium subglobosum LB1 TaxID=1410327 RepID=UPI0006448C47
MLGTIIKSIQWSTLKKCTLHNDNYGFKPQLTQPIPFGVKELFIGNCSFVSATPGCLPSSITRLTLLDAKGLKQGDIPTSVKWLEMRYASTLANDLQVLPSSIRNLQLRNTKIQPDVHITMFPKSIISMKIVLSRVTLKLIRLNDDLYFRNGPSINEYGFISSSSAQSILIAAQ